MTQFGDADIVLTANLDHISKENHMLADPVNPVMIETILK